MQEKKVKQSILIFVLIMLLCGYYLTPSSAISYKSKNLDGKIKTFPCNSDGNIQQGETICTGLELDNTGNCMLKFENSDSVSQSVIVQ